MASRNGGYNKGLQPCIGKSGLEKLSALLRNEGHRALNGGSAFTLTTKVLDQLNTECRRHSISINDGAGTDVTKYSESTLSQTNRQKVKQVYNKAKTEWNDHVQFIKDFMQFTPSLKLMGCTTTLTSAISLHRFGNLTSLNLQKVPIHMVEGLQLLRNTLTSITMYKSIDRVKDLLENCGGDMCVPSTWSQLKFVSFTFNCLSELDDSFCLLPYVEVLDLSHNSLQTCDHFLEYLNDVRCISLAYNVILQVPSVSVTSRASLTNLVLRGNNLDNLTGLEELRALQQLDLGENCISAHSALDPLNALVNLQQLQLDGNPLFYHRLHRQLTASSLAPQAANVQFELDKRMLTASEISYFLQVMAQFEKMVSSKTPQRGAPVRRGSFDRGFENSLSSFSGNDTKSDSADISSPKRPRKMKHKRLKARDTPIMDRDISGEIYYSQEVRPGSVPLPRSLEQQWKDRKEEALKTKREIEDLRRHYGPNWLLAIEDKDIFTKKDAILPSGSSQSEKEKARTGTRTHAKATREPSNSPGLDVTQSMKSSEDIRSDALEALPETSGSGTGKIDSTKPVMSTIARMASGLPPDRSESESKSSLGNVNNSNLNKSQPQSFYNPLDRSVNSSVTADSDMTDSKEPRRNAAEAKEVCDKSASEADLEICDSKALHKSSSSNQNIPESSSEMKSVTVLPEQLPLKPKPAFLSENSETGGEAFSTLKSSTDSPRSSGEMENRQATLEEAEVAESMFVICPLRNNEMIILSMTAFFLVEKDVRGAVTEKLALSSLRKLEWKMLSKYNTNEEDDEKSQLVLDGYSEKHFEDSNRSVLVEDKEEVRKGGVDESIQLDLKFDYLRKDKQSRRYVVDVPDGNQIISHLQPFLDSRKSQASERSRSLMQCLKCNQTCHKSELLQPSNSGSSSGVFSSHELTGKDTQMCPKCGSTLVIELASASAIVRSASSDTSAPAKSKRTPARRVSGLTRRFIRSMKTGFDHSKDDQSKLSGSSTGRDRSSAFRAPSKMSRSAIVSICQQAESSGDELVCVEDYFSVDAMSDITTSSQLAKVTSSLQGDSSFRGSKANAGKASVSVLHQIDHVEAGKNNMNPRCVVGSSPDSKIQTTVDNSTKPISIQDKRRKIAMDETRDEETGDNEEACSVSGLKAAHSSLAAMNDIVNTLINEGKCLEGKKNSNVNPHRKDNERRVSVASISRSSHDQIRAPTFGSLDTSGAIMRLRLSESYSFPPTVPALASGVSFDAVSPPLTYGSPENPVAFSVGTPVINNLFEAGSKVTQSTTRLTLTASVHSDRSSTYETSVSPPESENYAASIVHCKDAGVAELSTTGSFNVESRRCSENLLSIYDHPRETQSLSKLSRQKLTPASSVPSSEASRPLPDGGTSHIKAVDVLATSETQWSENSHRLSRATNDEAVVSEDEEEMSDEDNDPVPNYGFHHLNHRLTLHLMMSLFGADEDFVCKIQCPIVQYIIKEPYDGILVMSSLRFYVLKITSQNHSQPPDQWLQCVESQPILELRYIDVGLGGQSLRLEFITDCSSFTCIIQNRDKTAQFVEVLHNNLAKYAVRHCISSHVVVNEDVDQMTMNNLDLDVVSKNKPDQKLLFYCMGFVERDNQERCLTSLVVTSCDICLVNTNHQWPQPRLQAPITVETVGQQFAVLERQKITNVASLEVCEVTLRKIHLELFTEAEGTSKNWKITLSTRQTAVDFITALAGPWAQQFGVEMDITYAELDF